MYPRRGVKRRAVKTKQEEKKKRRRRCTKAVQEEKEASSFVSECPWVESSTRVHTLTCPGEIESRFMQKKVMTEEEEDEEEEKEAQSLCLLGNSKVTLNLNVLSFDCGISNLSYCLLEHDAKDGFRIVLWEHINLKAGDLRQAVRAMVRAFDERPWMVDVDTICIETQVLKNTQMKVISHVIQTYFECKSKVVVNFVAALSKFKAVQDENLPPVPTRIKELTAGNQTKQTSVFLAEKLLESKGHFISLRFLRSFKKKDDLADSFLQGLWFLKMEVSKRTKATRIKTSRSKKKNLTTSERLRLLMNEHATTVEGEGEGETRVSVDYIDLTDSSSDAQHSSVPFKYFDESKHGMNEGVEFGLEVLLPKVYEDERGASIPRVYDCSEATVSSPLRCISRLSTGSNKSPS